MGKFGKRFALTWIVVFLLVVVYEGWPVSLRTAYQTGFLALGVLLIMGALVLWNEFDNLRRRVSELEQERKRLLGEIGGQREQLAAHRAREARRKRKKALREERRAFRASAEQRQEDYRRRLRARKRDAGDS